MFDASAGCVPRVLKEAHGDLIVGDHFNILMSLLDLLEDERGIPRELAERVMQAAALYSSFCLCEPQRRRVFADAASAVLADVDSWWALQVEARCEAALFRVGS